MHILSLNIIVDCFKGVLRGTNKALGIYKLVFWQNLFCNWFFFMSSIYVLCFRLGYGLEGIWISKLMAEGTAQICYYSTIRS